MCFIWLSALKVFEYLQVKRSRANVQICGFSEVNSEASQSALAPPFHTLTVGWCEGALVHSDHRQPTASLDPGPLCYLPISHRSPQGSPQLHVVCLDLQVSKHDSLQRES